MVLNNSPTQVNERKTNGLVEITILYFAYDQIDVCRKHFSKVVQLYSQNVCVNLVNQDGSEGMLEKSFAEMIRLLNDPSIRYSVCFHTSLLNKWFFERGLNFLRLRYESFDFHKQCGKNRWDRLSILINRLANDQDQFGFVNML